VGDPVAKITTIELSELVPVKKERRPSAKQLALMKREATYEAAISKLQRGHVARFEPTDEKLATLRASLQRVINRNPRTADLHLAIIGGVAYVALEPIPGARKPRTRKAG
jgi:hypothetical protein